MHPNHANSNMAINLLLQQHAQRVESSARSNAAMARCAKTMAEAVRLSFVSIPAEVRFMQHSLPGLRTLSHAIEDRLRVLVKERLKVIECAETGEDAKTARARFMQECTVLRGEFAMIYRIADSESQRIVYLKTKAEKAVENPAAPEAPASS